MNLLENDKRFEIKVTNLKRKFFSKEETVLSIGNGFVVSRGLNDEALCFKSRETYISGFFDKNCESEVSELVNIPDFFEYDIIINGEMLDLLNQELLDYEKKLNILTGVLSKKFTVKINGILVNIKTSKYFDINNKNMGYFKIDIKADTDCNVIIIDKIDGTYSNNGIEHLKEAQKTAINDVLSYTTKSIQGRDLYISSEATVNEKHSFEYQIKRKKISRSTIFKLKKQEIVNYEKKISVSVDKEKKLMPENFKDHEKKWLEIWQQMRVNITGNPQWQNCIDLSCYLLIINSNLDDEYTNLAAKGLTGHGYKGHTFWDTEIFLLPFYIANFPAKAKNLLIYRNLGLEEAKRKALSNGFEGAMYPWEMARPEEKDATPLIGPINIKTGKVEKIENAELEIHISSDVAYGFDLYYEYTKDNDFIKKYGIEVIIETAIFWLSRLEFNVNEDRYEIKNVIGPDEYKEHVDNNTFTNYMARYNILLVGKFYNLGIINDEFLIKHDYNIEKNNEKAGKIYIQPANEKMLIGQDDTYLSLKHIDLEKYKNNANVASINKDFSMSEKCQIQVSKQADLLMLFQMFKSEFSDIVKKANFDYYENKCLHDSSLSLVTHSIVACDLGENKIAENLMNKSLNIDYAGALNSSDEGIHFASLGGHWLSLVRGFTGVDVMNGLDFSPNLPSNIEELCFKFYYKNNLINVLCNEKMIIIESENDLEFSCNNIKYNCLAGESIKVKYD